jgi:hypothetical protein
MRAELIALLWLVAAGSVAYAATRLTLDGPLAPPEPKAPLETIPLTQASIVSRPHTTVADLTWDGRTIFPETASLAAAQAPTAATAVAPPVLKGIVEQDGYLRAVFAAPDGVGAPYIVATTGETVGGLKMLSIDRDGITAAASDGTVVTMKLRGAGEAL